MSARVAQEKRHSPTAIKAFDQCPKKWEFQYRIKPKIDRKIGPPLILGNAVHKVLEQVLLLPPANRSVSAAQDLLREVWPQIEGRGEAFESREEEKQWGEKGLAIIETFAATPDWEAVPLHIEEWASLPLPGGSELFGRIDRVDGFEDGIELIDYKTGKCRMAADGLDQDIGAQVYAVAGEHTFGKPVRRVRFIFLEAGEDRIWDPDEDLGDLKELLADEVDVIESTTEFETRTSRLCDWCDYQPLCPAFAAA